MTAALDYRTATRDQIRGAILTPEAFVQLVLSLLPGGINPKVRDFLSSLGRWLDEAPDEELRYKAPAVVEMMEQQLAECQHRLPHRIPWQQIAHDYWVLCRDGKVQWTKGLPYSWLAARFNCSALGVPEDFPYHGQIGIGHNAGRAAVDEELMVRDAFFVLAKAHRAERAMHRVAQEAQTDETPEDKALPIVRSLNQSIAAYSRLSVLSFYAFVECFVNSVGEDYIARNPLLPSCDVEVLRGHKRNGGYLSTEQKIEKFPSLIRTDRRSPLILSDPAQIAEPFKSFVQHIKSIRDASAHYSKQKAPIWMAPHEWIDIADRAAEVCMGVAQGFWRACYPTRCLPMYLGQLDIALHRRIADKRLDMEASAEA